MVDSQIKTRELLDRRQAADRLTVPVSTLDHWQQTGYGPAYLKIGRARRYDAAELDDWLQAQRQSA